MLSSLLANGVCGVLAQPATTAADPNIVAPVSPPPLPNSSAPSVVPELSTATAAKDGPSARITEGTKPVIQTLNSQAMANTQKAPPKTEKPVFGAPGKAIAAPLPPPSATVPPETQKPRSLPSIPSRPGEDSYPSVGRMEKITFGNSQIEAPIENRLNKLEVAIYKKTFSELSLFDRTQQLKKTLLGNDDEPTADIDNLRVPHTDWAAPAITDFPTSEPDYFEGIAQRPENQKRATTEEVKQFAIELINYERAKLGIGPLAIDDVADKLAQEHDDELCRRNAISHENLKGENPDRRYTLSGGTGALSESIISNKTPDTFSKMPSKASAVYVLKTIMSRQDDRDAIMNADATNIGMAIKWTPNKDKVIAVTEVVTNHGIIHPLPNDVHVGEKLEVKGVVTQPYKFDRITVAWEANRALGAAADESEEALPYFPPLDYVAFAGHSQHDYSAAIGTLRTVGIIAAIAGGMFMPPVALAAPMIAMSGGMGSGEPKPASDIPIHGGVKVEGSTFIGRVPISKEGKEGIYYVTVWGSTNNLAKPIAISRRAIVAKAFEEDVSAQIEPSAHQKKHKKPKP